MEHFLGVGIFVLVVVLIFIMLNPRDPGRPY